jgi:PAS domain S-box-containing protein
MILQETAGALVSALGVQLQLAASLLCLGLGLVVRRGVRNTPWLTWWAACYGAVAVAVAAILVRYYMMPAFSAELLDLHEPHLVSVLYAVYAGAKMIFLFCLLAGTWLFVTRTPLTRIGLGAGIWFIAAVGLLFVLAPIELDGIMAWQAGLAVPVFLACAWLLFTLPADRRTRGSRILAAVCVLLAGLWTLYIPGFLGMAAGSETTRGVALLWLTAHNSYVDTLFEFLLGFGMMMAVLDDVFIEAEQARTARLKEVAASEARLSQIIRAASDGIVLLDGERRIVHCNPAALDILGSEEAELLGVSFDRFVTSNQVDELWTPSRRRIRRTGVTPPGGHELMGRRADGTEFPVEISLRPVGASDTEGFVLIVRDRTQQVQQEAEREQTQAQSAQAARLETIGRMVSGVAHELNNPLTAILAFAQDLLSQSRSIPDTEALTTIVSQSQRCRVIVQDLLTSARGGREDRRPMAPDDIVARILPVLERQAAEQGIGLEVALPRNLPLLLVNPPAIEQVLTNLVVNAFHAVPGGGKVKLFGQVVEDQVTLVVEDNGPGLSDDVLPHLFEPFFTTKAPGEGTGLGLSVSRAIIDQHGGTLRAENRSGAGARGARFTVSLPFLDRRTAERTPAELPPTDLSHPAPMPARHLLVVDDEAPIRVAIRRFLERRNWTVEEAQNGREALEILGLDDRAARPTTDRFDAIISDLRMPGVTGMEIHDRLARSAPNALAKLVLITGDTASAEVVEFVARLRQPLLNKPFDMGALAELLDRTAPPTTSAPR